jgi:hypothetical protein
MLAARYGPEHPDVARQRRQIDALESITSGSISRGTLAQQRDDLASRDLEIDAEQGLEIAIEGLQPMRGQKRRAHASTPI